MNYSDYPIFKLLLPYVIGICIAYFGNLHYSSCLILYLIILCNILISIVLFKKLSYPRQWIASIPIFVALMLVGTVTTFQKYNSIIPLQEVKKMANNTQFVAQVMETPIEKEKSIKIIVQFNGLENKLNKPYLAVIYLKKDSAALNLSYGDVILFNARLSAVSPPENPYSFDNQTYLRRKGILFTGYVQEKSWVYLCKGDANVIKQSARQIQCYFSNLFKTNGLQGDEYAIITAILLGNDDTMAPELKSQYAAAGVSHILCVSGMHVGIIYMILNFLFKPLDLSRRMRILKTFILLLFIWAFACITGLSPSVQRAAAMFTFVSVGSLLSRNANIFHSLFASLFILLLINPLLLFEIGFEMSYLAVFGIVILQKPIAAIYHPKTKIADYFWQLISVSVAAQLATFPLSIYYFGQFPNYFLLANLSVMMLSFVIVITGVVLLVTSFVDVVAHFIGIILTYEIKLMNYIIQSIDSLPYSVTSNISYSALQVILFYLCIFTVFRYFTGKKKKMKYFALSLGTLLLFSFAFDKYKSMCQNDVTVYSIDKTTAIGFNYHGKCTLFVDTGNNKNFYDFNIKNHERKARITSVIVPIDTQHYVSDRLLKVGDWINYEGYTFYFLSGNQKKYSLPKQLSVDFLYVRHNPKISMRKLIQFIDFKYVIIDKSNSVYYAGKWVDSCQYYQIPYYSLRENGYFSLTNDFIKK